MPKRRIALVWILFVLSSSAGCEITASCFVQHDLNSNPRLDKPDGQIKAEIKVTKLVGRDAER